MGDLELPRRMFRNGEDPKGGKINIYQKTILIKKVMEVLDEDEIKKLKEVGFSGMFDLPQKPAFSRAFILMLLSRQLETANKKELWIVFAGKPVRISLREFNIVSGLRSDKYPPTVRSKKKDTYGEKQPYYGTLFGLETGVDALRVIEILRNRKVTDPDMRLRYAALVIIDGVLLATSQLRVISDKHAEMSRDLEKFLKYPWGRRSFEAMVDSIKKRKVWQLALQAVTVQGFAHEMQLVLVVAAPSIQVARKPPPKSDDEEEEERVLENQPTDDGGKNEQCGVLFLLGNARKLDNECEKTPVEVETIICPDHEFIYPDENLKWDGEHQDVRVTNLITMIREGKFQPGMLRGGQLMSRIKKPPKEIPATKAHNERGRKAKGRVVRGSGSRARETSPTIDEDENAEDPEDSDTDVEDRIQERVRELGDTLSRKLEDDVKKILKSSEASIIESVTAWMRNNLAQQGIRRESSHGASPENWSGFCDNPVLQFSPRNVPPVYSQADQFPISGDQRGSVDGQTMSGDEVREKDVPADNSGAGDNANLTNSLEEDEAATLNASPCIVTNQEVDEQVTTAPPEVTTQVDAMQEDDVGISTTDPSVVQVEVGPTKETNEQLRVMSPPVSMHPVIVNGKLMRSH